MVWRMITDALRTALVDRTEALAAHLVGGAADRKRRVWHAARKADGGFGDSLEIELKGDRRSLWIHRASGRGGDLIDLIAYVNGGSILEAGAWARDWLGSKIEEGAPKPAPKARTSETETAHQTLAPKWRKFWEQCRLITPDSPAGRYLTGRCCALPANDVRWHPEAWHWFERRAMPAMVALLTDIASGEPISLHFTFIKADGNGKAKIEAPRLYLADHRKAGGVVRLDPDESVESGLIVGEGLETCLSYRLQFAPVWSLLDAGNLGDFPVLPGVEGLTVLVDRDPAGERAFEVVRDRYRAAGRTLALDIIRIAASEAGRDINDVVACDG